MTISGHAVRLVAGACCLLMAATATAQTRPGRPPAGPRFSANAYGGWDAPLFDPSSSASLQPTSQWFSGFDANLSLNKTGRRVSMSTNATASTRYYPQFTPSTAPSYGAAFSLSSINRGRWQWGLTQFAHYAPFSATSLFVTGNTQSAQVLQLANATAFQQSTVRQVDVNTAGSLSYAMSRRTTVGIGLLAGGLIPIDSQLARAIRLNANVRVARNLTRNLTGYLSYSASQNRVASKGTTAAANYTVSGFDFGFDFGRGLQLTRTTTLGFRVGLVNVPETNGQAYQLTGGATIDRQFRNGWNAQIAAMRDARFVQTYRDAVVFSGVSVSAGGRLIGNLGTTFSTNYSSGTINAGTSVGFRSYSASTMLRYDLRRLVATFIDYSAFYSEVDANAVLAGQPVGKFGRHSIRGGLTFGLSPFSIVP